MFYAHFVLSKKGPLARIWLAAHWDKKLTKAHVFETNISSSVEAILEPKVKMALRTSGHLLLGVVRIYSRKAKYLLADCNEAFVKIKMAFRPGVVDLPEDMNREAAIAAITLPENFHDFEATMSDLAELDKSAINVNQSRPEDITMREDFGEINLGRPDDDFGDSTFDDTKASAREQMREAGESRIDDDALAADVTSILDHTDKTVNSTKRSGVAETELLDDDVDEASGGKRRRTDRDGPGSGAGSPRATGSEGRPEDVPDTHEDDDFGDEMAGGFLDAPDDDDDNAVDDFGGEMDHDLFGAGIFDDPSAQKQLEHITSEFESHLDPHGFNLDVSGAEGGATPARVPATPRVHDAAAGDLPGAGPREEGDGVHPPVTSTAEMMAPGGTLTESVVGVGGGVQHTTLMSNDGEAFALPPVDASAVGVHGASAASHAGMGGLGQQNAQAAQAPVTAPPRARHTTKRKRKLIIDEQKSIPSEVMKLQMSDTSDIVSSLDLAPPTKKLMFWKETGSVEKLFAMPGRAIVSRSLLRLFARNLLTSIVPDLEEEMPGATAGAGGATPASHRVHSGPGGHLEPSVTDEEATAAMLLVSEPNLTHVTEEPIDGLRAVAEMTAPVQVRQPAAAMSAIMEESNVGLSTTVLEAPPTTSVSSVVDSAVVQAADALAAAAEATVHEVQPPQPPPPPPQMDIQPQPHEQQHEVSQSGVESLGVELAQAAKELPPPPGTLEPPRVGHHEVHHEAREDPMMPVVPRPQDTPHPTDYFAPETPAPYLNPPSIMSMGPPSVLPPDPEEECLLGAPGAAARQLEREYEEAEVEMNEALDNVDENTNQELLEERRLERRSKVMMKMLRHVLSTPETQASFDNFVTRNNRKQVASKFYTMLVLRKQRAVELSQSEPYGDITISQGPNYQSLLATAF